MHYQSEIIILIKLITLKFHLTIQSLFLNKKKEKKKRENLIKILKKFAKFVKNNFEKIEKKKQNKILINEIQKLAKRK